MELKDLQKLLFEEYQKNGYHSKWTDGFKNNNPNQAVFDIAELGLVGTEIAEAMEEVRNDNQDKLMFECADIIIRTLNFMTRKGTDVEFYILAKHKRNMERGNLHGRKL